MARGEMVRYLAENNITTIEEVKNFDHPHYKYSKEHSDLSKIVFLYEE
jgi:cytoplasmic iron level regulating protein YaaA (DUF328/UPF0246 family)